MNELITQEQIKEIVIRLNKWCNERYLTYKIQQEGLRGNLLEEYTELTRAIKSNNINDIIDALCDICIFSINSLENPLSNINKIYNLMTMFNNSTRVNFYDNLTDIIIQNKKIDSTSSNINNMMLDYFKYREIDIIDIISTSFVYIDNFGYDIYKCLDETIKEIDSRKGYYCPNTKKFIKVNSNSMYKADYSVCKRD